MKVLFEAIKGCETVLEKLGLLFRPNWDFYAQLSACFTEWRTPPSESKKDCVKGTLTPTPSKFGELGEEGRQCCVNVGRLNGERTNLPGEI